MNEDVAKMFDGLEPDHGGFVRNDFDPVSHPRHYTTGKIECIDAIEAATTGMKPFPAFCSGNSIKYVWRHTLKGNPVQDLMKARWYIDKMIEFYQKESH